MNGGWMEGLCTLFVPAEHAEPRCAPQVAMLVGKAKTAEGAFLKAEEVASAAMEAAEEAVRDEMECIAGESWVCCRLNCLVMDADVAARWGSLPRSLVWLSRPSRTLQRRQIVSTDCFSNPTI